MSNIGKCPTCGSSDYKVGHFMNLFNCKCKTCGNMFSFSIKVYHISYERI